MLSFDSFDLGWVSGCPSVDEFVLHRLNNSASYPVRGQPIVVDRLPGSIVHILRLECVASAAESLKVAQLVGSAFVPRDYVVDEWSGLVELLAANADLAATTNPFIPFQNLQTDFLP